MYVRVQRTYVHGRDHLAIRAKTRLYQLAWFEPHPDLLLTSWRPSLLLTLTTALDKVQRRAMTYSVSDSVSQLQGLL